MLLLDRNETDFQTTRKTTTVTFLILRKVAIY